MSTGSISNACAPRAAMPPPSSSSPTPLRFPRFNTPLELGLFLGCKRFGPPNQSRKRTPILDSDKYRYRSLIWTSRVRTSEPMGETRTGQSGRFATGSDWHRSVRHCPEAQRLSATTAVSKTTCRIFARSSGSNRTALPSCRDDHRLVARDPAELSACFPEIDLLGKVNGY
jgi:hypothetical protein